MNFVLFLSSLDDNIDRHVDIQILIKTHETKIVRLNFHITPQIDNY